MTPKLPGLNQCNGIDPLDLNVGVNFEDSVAAIDAVDL
jgi:hypothetical protein